MQRFAPSELSSRLDAASALRPVIASSMEFRRDIVLEQLGPILNEIKKNRVPYAQIEARTLAGIAHEAQDLDTHDAAKRATNADFDPLVYLSRQMKGSLRRPA